MSRASRTQRPSEAKLREMWGLLPNLFNLSWYTSGGTNDLSDDAIEYADMIIRLLEEFKKLQREEQPSPVWVDFVASNHEQHDEFVESIVKNKGVVLYMDNYEPLREAYRLRYSPYRK